jgi:hypothetical protein
MTARLQASTVIDRPVSDVFHFCADEHVSNDPCWDPDIYLEKVVDAPLAVDSMIRRLNSRTGMPVQGAMEVVEFDRDRAMGVKIKDGPAEMLGPGALEAVGPGKTRLTIRLEILTMADSADTIFLQGRVQQSLERMKPLIEPES